MKPWGVHEGLAVYRIGEGQPIFFMPGPHRFERPGLRNADTLIAGLQKLHRQVITYDPPFSGASWRPARLSMQEMLDCTDEALDYIGVTSPIDVIGHSMGGMASLAYAIARPSRVKGLVLIGTGSGDPPYMNAPGALWNMSHPKFGAMARLGILQMMWPARAPERMLNNFIQAESFYDRSRAVPITVELADWFRPTEGRADWARQARKLNYSPRLGQIKVPVLVMCGRGDPQFPLACSMELVERIPDAQLVIFERSGHYPFIEEPETFWAAVARFLATQTAVKMAP